MAKCDACPEEVEDPWTCASCLGSFCPDHHGDHVCSIVEEENGSGSDDDGGLGVDEEDRRYDQLVLGVQPEAEERQEPPEEIEEDGPELELPARRGGQLRSSIDEDYRKIGVATWNLHGLNDRRYRGETYAEEVPNRLKSLGRAVGELVAVLKGLHEGFQPLRSRLRRRPGEKEEPAPKLPETDEEVAAALALKLQEFWGWVALKADLEELNQTPDEATLQELLARIQKLAGGDCSVATATECIILRTRIRRIVGSEEAWTKAYQEFLERLPAKERKHASSFTQARRKHPLCPVLDALVALDQSLNTHLIIAHINSLMAKNEWLDAFILQEVRPEGLKLLEEELDESLRLTFGPCMAGVATTKPPPSSRRAPRLALNQREYYPVVTRTSTIQEVSSFAIACVKDEWTEPDMPKDSKARSELWPLEDDEDLGVDTYRGPENDQGELDTINILWSKERRVYRPVVVYELKTEDGLVTIGNVHTSPGEDNEWWRFNEYDQLEVAFEAGGQDGFWLMGGDYYLSAEARVQKSDDDLSVTELEDDETAESIIELFEHATQKKFQPDAESPTKRRKLEQEVVTTLTVGQAQRAIFSTSSTQERPTGLQWVLDREYGGELRSDTYVPQPFANDFHEQVANTERLDKHQTGEDIFRNVLGLTFEKTLPVQWNIAQAISGSNTHQKLADFPAYAAGPGKIPLDRVERARRFTRAHATSKMRIADFFIFNEAWRRPKMKKTLACKIGLLAPIEVGAASGIHWYDEENLAISRYWMAMSDHFPVGGVFTTDLQEPVLKKLTAAPFVGAPMKASTLPPIAPDSELDFALVPMPQDGDCFFEGLKAALELEEEVDDIRQYALLEESKLPKVYVGWPDWEAVAKHYGVTVVVHEYHYGEPDRFAGLLDEVNPGQKRKVHMRLIHVPDQSASHMDLLLPL